MNDQEVRLDLDKPVEEEAVHEPVAEAVEQKKNEDFIPEIEEPVVDTEVEAEKTTRCPDCPLKAGLKDENTLCPTCNGTGLV